MLEFEARNFEELENEATERAHEVSISVVKAVIKALDKGADKVVVGVLSTLDLDLTVDSTGYLQALETNLIRCEQAEEYELCKDAINWIKKLRK